MARAATGRTRSAGVPEPSERWPTSPLTTSGPTGPWGKTQGHYGAVGWEAASRNTRDFVGLLQEHQLRKRTLGECGGDTSMPSAQPQCGLKLFRRKASKLEQQSCFPEAEGQQGLTLGLEPWRVERGGRLE